MDRVTGFVRERRIGRRAAVAGALGLAAAAGLSGCAASSAGGQSTSAGGPTPFQTVQARPATVAGKVVLTFQPWQDAYGFGSLHSLNEILYAATASFRDKYPSVELRFWGPEINPVTSVIAGQGPDVPQLQGGGGGIDGWLTKDLLVDLTPYIKASNVNLHDFAAGQLATVTTPQGIFGIPNYMGTAGIAINLSVLDAVGLKYPDLQWDYKAYESLARSVSGNVQVGGRSVWRTGTTIDWSDNGPDAFYYHGFGGSVVDPADPARSTVDSQGSVAAGNFLFPLLWDRVAARGRVPGNFVQGLTVCPFFWLQSYIIPAATQWTNFKWNFWPMPTWPKGAFTMTNPNYFAISKAAQRPDLAWELLDWLTVQPDWQRAMMRTVLLSPSYLPLWDEYVQVVETVAPTLKNKNVSVFANLVRTTNVVQVNGSHFAYRDTEAKAILGQWTARILAQNASVQSGFHSAAQQINALEAVAGTSAAAATAAARAFPAKGPTMASVPTGV